MEDSGGTVTEDNSYETSLACWRNSFLSEEPWETICFNQGHHKIRSAFLMINLDAM